MHQRPRGLIPAVPAPLRFAVLALAILLLASRIANGGSLAGEPRTDRLSADGSPNGEPLTDKPPADEPRAEDLITARFPTVTGSNLDGKEFTLPEGFEGLYNLVFIAFHREQQWEVISWEPLARRLTAQDQTLRYYEVPAVRRGNPVMRTMVSRGMAAFISDRKARASTITLFLDKDPFEQALGIANEDSITVLLVDRAGGISWRTMGGWNRAKELSLKEALRNR